MIRLLRGEFTVSTVLILVLSATSNLLGLTWRGHYPETDESLVRIYAQDAVILAISVQILAIGAWYARRGSTWEIECDSNEPGCVKKPTKKPTKTGCMEDITFALCPTCLVLTIYQTRPLFNPPMVDHL